MQNHGLSESQLLIIKQILKPYASRIIRVGLFGSRATSNFRPNSDIDLVIYGNLVQAEQERLFTLFNDSLLSVPVDVCVYNLITYLPFKAHIDQFSITLFSSENLNQ